MFAFLIIQSRFEQEFNKVKNPITAAAWNGSGNLLAYAASYDWGKGHSGASQASVGPQIFVHACLDSEVRPRAK